MKQVETGVFIYYASIIDTARIFNLISILYYLTFVIRHTYNMTILSLAPDVRGIQSMYLGYQ